MEAVLRASARPRATTMFEIRMDTSLFRGYPARWIIDQQSVQKVKAVLLHAGDQSATIISTPFREGGLEIRKGRHSWPGQFIWGAQ